MICLLQVIEGPLVGHQCWLREDQHLSIGRLSTSDFPVMGDLHMSRLHLLVEGSQSRFRLRDVGSSNGTWVNETQVSSVEICDGDTIRAGRSAFRVTLRQSVGEPAADGSMTNLTPFAPGAGPGSDAQQTLASLPAIPVRTVHRFE
jgi:pSer/pThr/pTyr-binding forkhead associated (FHA) protein